MNQKKQAMGNGKSFLSNPDASEPQQESAAQQPTPQPVTQQQEKLPQEQIISVNGTEYYLEKELGRGAQGVVFKVGPNEFIFTFRQKI